MTYVRIMWALSLIGFLVVLLYVHVFLPEVLQIDFNGDGAAESVIGKSVFFYICLTVLVVINGALLAFGNMFNYLPGHAVPVPRKKFWTQDKYTRNRLHKNFKAWLKGVMLFINLFLVVNLLNVYSLYDEFATYSTAWMYYVIAALVAFWLAFYFVLFNRPELTEE